MIFVCGVRVLYMCLWYRYFVYGTCAVHMWCVCVCGICVVYMCYMSGVCVLYVCGVYVWCVSFVHV